MLNLVIKLKEGKITDIVWDNQCYACESKLCMSDLEAKNLYTGEQTKYSNCRGKEIKKEFFGNDPRFYVTWFGTDKAGRQLKSSNMAMSKFKNYDVTSLGDALKDSVKIGGDVSTKEQLAEKVVRLLMKDLDKNNAAN